MKKYLAIIVLLAFIYGCATTQSREAVDKGSKPVIVDSYASETVRPGAVWMIFIQAGDEDGDMKDIFTTVSSPVYSFPKYKFTPIRKDNRESLEGYLFVSTPLSTYLLGEKFNLTVNIRDSAGNVSESIVFPLLFSKLDQGQVPERWQTAKNTRLGGVFADYFRYRETGLRNNVGFNK